MELSSAGLRHGDIASIAEEGAERGLRFADAQTVEPYSDYWVLRLRTADGALYRIDSWASWRALLEVLEPSRRPSTASTNLATTRARAAEHTVSKMRAPKKPLPITEPRRLAAALADLNLREQRILKLRYGLDGEPPQPLREVGRRLGISGERVRQLEMRARSTLTACNDSIAHQSVPAVEPPNTAKRRTPPGASLACDALQAWTLLLLRGQPGHGYELIKRLRERGFDIPGPRLYRLLCKLEQRGLLRSDWVPFGGTAPERRVYRLSSKGRRQLDEDAETLNTRCQSLQLFFAHHAEILAS